MNADSGNQAGCSNKKSIYAYVGCRTTKERNARGVGINVYCVDPVTRNWEHVETVKTQQENPQSYS